MINTNDLTVKALEISAKVHKHQVRKGSGIPYIVHPVEVAMILQKIGASEEMIAAALLHGVLDNPDIGLSGVIDLIEKSFGEKAHKIIKIINGVLERLENMENIPWKVQKQQTFDYLSKEDTPLEIKMVFCAEKLSNIRDLVRDYREISINLLNYGKPCLHHETHENQIIGFLWVILICGEIDIIVNMKS
ncbi:HD domain-containing protein [Crassaminicella profunda]|uniref:HD domain-containing protein n=1 Tax=Crassaminicella profunda TaxID=1286698 RepID=UPI001CA61FC0|nr:HD domain-containing protein [Crassaminicella profunda]QZY56840.1 HD domain-containing protein [Crassaminicella profunda]